MDKYLTIYPSGDLCWVELHTGHFFPGMYNVIGCDCVEMVQTIIPGICIVVDESGRVKYPPQRHNDVASRLYRGWHFGVGDIVGPAIVVAVRPTGPYHELDWFPLNAVELAHLSLALGLPIPEK